MSDQDDKKLEQLKEIQKEVEKQIEKRESEVSNENFHESYQPTKNELDDNNPPGDE